MQRKVLLSALALLVFGGCGSDDKKAEARAIFLQKKSEQLKLVQT